MSGGAAGIPTFVVCAVRRPGDPIPELEASETFIIPNGEGPLNLSEKWNSGLDMAEAAARRDGHQTWNVAVVNDDLEPEPDLLELLAEGLRFAPDIWITFLDQGRLLPHGLLVEATNERYAGQTLTGYAFMLRGETGLRFDTGFRWWYGDTDLERHVRQMGKRVACVGGAYGRHRTEARSTAQDPSLLALAREDEARFAEKWGVDPTRLWLAVHPDWPAVPADDL